jgi:hypothetical protein
MHRQSAGSTVSRSMRLWRNDTGKQTPKIPFQDCFVVMRSPFGTAEDASLRHSRRTASKKMSLFENYF